MAPNPSEETPTTKSIAAPVASHPARVRKAQQMHHGETVVTREADYKGHHIVVRSHYEVEVDGRPLMGHTGVTDSGLVHYHPIPNLSYSSALDMVRKIIDVFPEDFGAGAMPDSPMHHDSRKLRGMAMKKKHAAKKTSRKGGR